MDSFSLMADMGYIIQNGTRILRALFEICQKRFWGRLAENFLFYCRAIERRVAPTRNPLCQFSLFCNMGGFTASTTSEHYMGGYIKQEILNRVEDLGITVEKLLEMDDTELKY